MKLLEAKIRRRDDYYVGIFVLAALSIAAYVAFTFIFR
jgi:hypothetical protein